MTDNLTFLLVGRDDWQKDELLNLTLLNTLKEHNVDILWEDPAAKVILTLRKIEQKIRFLPKRVKRFNLRATQMLYGLFHPAYFLYIYRRRNGTIASRCDSLKRTINKHNCAERIVIISRSSGGRVSSLIADQMAIKKVICLGYPFKHPEHEDEPERYKHLADLKTPMLIIQGLHDEYGGMGLETQYTLSQSIEVSFFDTNHNFDINKDMATQLIKLIEASAGLRQKI